ncbi:MarR family winged helix-turn-helix transcriptional regulator [Rhizobium sp. BE258]|uniref:MarR family winged helix-turn-helix transcriptional regulator n=1 Tax=Rhizobium sp. BE258 TaxID=2817722 RepID=UPI000DD97866
MTHFEPQSCHCTSLRRAARSTTRFYDEILEPSGLSISQFALMTVASDHPETSSGSLGRMLGLDKSTFGRSLSPLLKAKLIQIHQSERDRRVRTVQITQAATLALAKADALWSEAERSFVSLVGQVQADRSRAVSSHVVERMTVDRIARNSP